MSARTGSTFALGTLDLAGAAWSLGDDRESDPSTGRFSIPFTARLVRANGAPGSTPSVLSTGFSDPTGPDTMGRLVHLPGDARYPAVTRLAY